MDASQRIEREDDKGKNISRDSEKIAVMESSRVLGEDDDLAYIAGRTFTAAEESSNTSVSSYPSFILTGKK